MEMTPQPYALAVLPPVLIGWGGRVGPRAGLDAVVNRKIGAHNVLSLYWLSYQVDFKEERRELESAGSGLGPTAGSFEHGNEYSISTNWGTISGICWETVSFSWRNMPYGIKDEFQTLVNIVMKLRVSLGWGILYQVNN
jgi:hypothetical protein